MDELTDTIRSAFGGIRKKYVRFHGVSGDPTGTLDTNWQGNQYVQIPQAGTGRVTTARVRGSAKTAGLPVEVEVDPFTLQRRMTGGDVAGAVYGGGASPGGSGGLAAHAPTHYLTGSDPLLVSEEAINWVRMSPGAVFGHLTIGTGIYLASGGVVFKRTATDLNLNSYYPVTGSKVFWIVLDSAGAASAIDSGVTKVSLLTALPNTLDFVLGYVQLVAGRPLSFAALDVNGNNNSTIGSTKLSVGSALGQGWRLLGNNGINASTHFLGSINDADVVFKRHNIESARLTSTGVVFQQDNAVNGLTVGKGANSLTHNTVLGLSALAGVTSGDSNTAIGFGALNANTTGGSNVAVGPDALLVNVGGSDNISIGVSSLRGNLGGYRNCAVGTASLILNSSGYSNVAVGYFAGFSVTTGHNNVFVGDGAGSSSQKADAVNSTAIGSGSYTTADNQVVIGNASVTTTILRGNVSGATLSLSATLNQIVLQSAGVTGTLTWTPTTANKIITLPDLTGTAPLGTGANTQLAYWSGANTLTSSASLIWDGAKLDVTGYIKSSSRVVITGQATWDNTSTGAVEFGYDPANEWGFVEVLARFPGTDYKTFLLTSLDFKVNTGAAPTLALFVDDVHNVKIGGTADRATTVGTNQLVIFDGTAPVGALADGIALYSASGIPMMMNAAGAGSAIAGIAYANVFTASPQTIYHVQPELWFDYSAVSLRSLVFATAGSARWYFRVNNTAESGGNAGSDIVFLARNDAGGAIGTALAITRSTMVAAFGAGLNTVGGVHVGGTTDPGTDNLLVDGTVTANGALSVKQTVAGLARVSFENLSDNAARRSDIKIATGSAGTEAIYFGIDQASSSYFDNRSGKDLQFQVTGSAKVTFFTTGGMTIGAATGGDKGAGTLNTSADIYKNNSAYTNPDYALEAWATGKVERFAGKPGAKDYRRMTLDEAEAHIKGWLRLPGITDEPMGIFERGDIVLEKIEELYTHVIELHHRLSSVERRSYEDHSISSG